MVTNATSPAFIVVSASDIADRAYEIYLNRGRAHGFDREDWLRAERELKTPAVNAPRNVAANVKKGAKPPRLSADHP